MLEDDVLKALITSCYTIGQLHSRMMLLRDFLNMTLFRSDTAFNPNLLTNEDKQFIDRLDKNLLAQFSNTNFGDTFKNLEAKIKAIKPLVIYTAVEIPEYEMALIGMYIRHNFRVDLVMDFKIDPSLIAGTALSLNGVYKDYSARNGVESHKQEIIEQFKTFLGK